jgi:hypothetical protein
MAVRKCPSCLTTVPAGRVAALSNDIECPGCGQPLEISPLSRNIAVVAGLAAAASVYYWATRPDAADSPLGWALPIVYAFLALSVVAPLVLMATADLRLKAASDIAPTAHADAAASHSPAGGHH